MAHQFIADTSYFFYLIAILYAALRASHLWGVYATKIIHQVALSGAYFLLNRISQIRSIVPSLAAMSLRWLLPKQYSGIFPPQSYIHRYSQLPVERLSLDNKAVRSFFSGRTGNESHSGNTFCYDCLFPAGWCFDCFVGTPRKHK